jgi:putative polyhydroxyalkanoate system protein
MATIDIKKPHSLSKDEAKKRAEQLAKGMESQLGIQWNWEGDKIKFNAKSGAAKGASGIVSVDDANVRVEVDLPFLLKAVKGTVESKISEKLGDVLKG